MQVHQLLAHAEPEPEEGRQLGLAKILLEPGGDVEEGLLQDVRGVEPRLEAPVHPQLDHPPQPAPVPLEQTHQRPFIPPAEPLHQLGRVLELARHGPWSDRLATWRHEDV